MSDILAFEQRQHDRLQELTAARTEASVLAAMLLVRYDGKSTLIDRQIIRVARACPHSTVFTAEADAASERLAARGTPYDEA